jgi:hypothetical protein
METTKTIKRPFKYKNKNFANINKLNDIIERTNLYMLNIYNFVKLYYVSDDSNNNVITHEDIYDVFLILRDGTNFTNKEHKFYDFYKKNYRQVYFNPIDNARFIDGVCTIDTFYLIDGSYLGQVIKNNIKVMLSAIKNNITYNFDKYLNKFIKNYMIKLCEKQIKYNSLVKKCSLYEFYSNIDTKIINTLKKEYHKYEIFTEGNLTNLCNKINVLNEKVKYCKKGKDNIFLDELKNIREHETNFNKIKGKILKIFKGESTDISEIPAELKSIFEIKDKIIPKLKKEYNDELKENPELFIQSMIFMNKYFEKNNIKTFNVFPSRSNVIPKHITIDTASMNVIFCDNKYSSIEQYKQEIYQKVFNFPDSYFCMNNKYTFTGTIQTDGISLSMLYMSDESYIKKLKIDNIKQTARSAISSIKKEMKDYINEVKKLNKNSKENKNEIAKLNKKIKELNDKIEEKNKIKTETDKNKNNKSKEDKKKYAQEFKNKIKKLKEEGNEDEIKIINRKNKEFHYLEDLTETELAELKGTVKKIYIDQGKTQLICALNELNSTYMYYSGKERGKIIKTKEHIEKINALLNKLGILKEYEKLKNLNKKTTNKEDLIKTLKIMNGINEKVYENSKVNKLRKEKLNMYIDKQKAESFVIKKLMVQLGIKDLDELKEYTIIIGDWKGNNNLKNNKSSMGIGMKRLLKKYVKKLYLIDEYRTSKISNINYNMYNKEEKNKEYYECIEHTIEIKSISKTKEVKVINKRMHGILTFKMDKKRTQCKYSSQNKGKTITVRRFIQRDKNAVLNFKTITDHFLEHKDRPKAFKRSTMG